MTVIRINVLVMASIAAAVVVALPFLMHDPAVITGVAGAFVGGLVGAIKSLSDPEPQKQVPHETVHKMLDTFAGTPAVSESVKTLSPRED